MRGFAHFGSISLLTLAIACGGGERTNQNRQTEPEPEAAAVKSAEETGQGAESGEIPSSPKATADESSEQAVEGGAGAGKEQPEAGDVAGRPRSVAPATESDEPGMKNWLLIEFARAIEPADLEWLKQNGFRVDTVMSEKTVRGWLEDVAGGAVIGKDPRIARIDAQMR